MLPLRLQQSGAAMPTASGRGGLGRQALGVRNGGGGEMAGVPRAGDGGRGERYVRVERRSRVRGVALRRPAAGHSTSGERKRGHIGGAGWGSPGTVSSTYAPPHHARHREHRPPTAGSTPPPRTLPEQYVRNLRGAASRARQLRG